MSPYSRSAGDGLVDRRTRQTLRPTRVHRWPHNSASHHLGTLHDVRLPHRPIWTLRRQWVKLQRGALLAHGRSGPDHAERLHGRVPPPHPTTTRRCGTCSLASSKLILSSAEGGGCCWNLHRGRGVNTTWFGLHTHDQLSGIRSSGELKEVAGSTIRGPRSRQDIVLVSRGPTKDPSQGVWARPDPSNS
ncbi:hypothetical protein BHM03_00057323 [Ensete ventricosum]|nr:hypothetical protein BHM03_00057323 [Ensete ventricosum]